MSIDLTKQTLASKGINDSTVSGATIKDALETLELATNGSGKVYIYSGSITALTTGEFLSLNGDPDALLDFDHSLIYIGKRSRFKIIGDVTLAEWIENLGGGDHFTWFNNAPGFDSSIFQPAQPQGVQPDWTGGGSIEFTPTEVSPDKWRFVCTANTCTENCDVTFYIFVDTILNPATGAITTPNAGGGLPDGTYGDITISGSGTNMQINSNVVTATEIAINAVTLPKISATGVGAGKVLTTNGTDMTWETPAGGITDGDYGDITVSGSGTAMNIDAGVVGTTELTDNSVTYAKVADNAIDTNKIVDSAVTDAKINTSAVITTKIASNAVTLPKIEQIAPFTMVANATGSTANAAEVPMGIIPLVTTFADCEYTASEIDIINIVVQPNVIDIGDIIVLQPIIHRRQNSGGTITMTPRLKLNGTVIQSLGGGASPTSNTNTYRLLHQWIFQVVSISGNTVTLGYAIGSSVTAITTASVALSLGATTAANGATTSISTFDFDRTVGATITISMQWASANVNAWIRVQQTNAYIIKKAV